MNSNVRVFKEMGLGAGGNVLPLSEFVLFRDLPRDAKINDERGAQYVKLAEEVLEAEIPFLPLSLYMEYKITGIRGNFEKLHHRRRVFLFYLCMAEAYERRGRFITKMVDVLWAILEETSWVIPAHYGHYMVNPGQKIPEVYKESQIPGLDLYAGSACALVALVKHLHKEELDKISPAICKRIDHQVYLRGANPFANVSFSWSGDNNGTRASNWTTHMCCTVLFATALCVEDLDMRVAVVRTAMRYLDNFTAYYPTDGSCEEGPGYWSGAGGAFFDSLEIIEDMTGGKVKVYDHPLVKNIGEYIARVNIDGKYSVNFSDANPSIDQPGKMIMRYGEKCSSPELYSYGKMAESFNKIDRYYHFGSAYREYKDALTPEIHEADNVIGNEAFWFDGNKIAIFRENKETSKGLYLATKGGTNGEAHNHMDVGCFMVFSNGKPVIVDPGVGGSYNHGYFQETRYYRWYLRGSAHSIPTVNGMEEKVGLSTTNPNEIAIGLTATSSDEQFDAKTKTVSMELATAFAEEVGIISMRRTCHMDRGFLTVTDDVKLRDEGEICFNYTLVDEPKLVGDGKLAVSDGRFLEFNPDGMEVVIEKFENTNLPYEDINVKSMWHRDNLWHLMIKTNAKEKRFTVTVK